MSVWTTRQNSRKNTRAVNQNFFRIINGMLGKNGSAIWIVLMQEGTNSMGIKFNKIYIVFVMFYWNSPRAFSLGLIYFTGVQLLILNSTNHSSLLSYIKYLYRSGNKMSTRCNRGFYCRSYCLLNMFWAPLCPSSAAQWLLPVVFKLLVWCGAEGYVSGLQDAAASCKPDT